MSLRFLKKNITFVFKKGMEHYIVLSNTNVLIRVASSDILYIESDGSYSSMVLIDDCKHVFSFNLATFEKKLESQLGVGSQMFIRLGKSLIINSTYIYSVNLSTHELVLFSPQVLKRFPLKASHEALKLLKNMIEDNVNKKRRILI